MRAARAILPFLFVACDGSTESEAPPQVVDPRPDPIDATGSALFLDGLDPVELELPDSSRPSGATAPTTVPIHGPFRYAGTTKKGLHQWVAPLPVRPRGLFFHKPEPGMSLALDGAELTYSRFGPADPMAWFHGRSDLTVYTTERTPPPSDGSLALTWATASGREAALNFGTSGQSPEDFLHAHVADQWDVRAGLLLPAPGRVLYRIDAVPPAAELSLRPGIVPQELDEGHHSDGATLLVTVREVGSDWTEALATLSVAVGQFPLRHVDLSAFAGKDVELELVSDPQGSAEGPDATLDYVFLGAPRVGSRRQDAPTTVMVFIDTLRPDHMSLYGYERDTTAPLDERLQDAAVFTQARSIAPWTLPSAKTALTGRKPEVWGTSTPLPALFHERGEPTAFLAGNIYLSSQFGLDRGWDLHRVELWPSADEVTDDAIDWLDEHEGMGGLLQVHYMDPHLPYLEPDSHRDRYADEGPGTLREHFHLSDVRKLGKKIQKDEATQAWIRDRYDNNIRYTADAVARLLDRLGDDDVVLIYADHGEEFYEHQGFEHGHTLFDELLRVPLVVKAPGLPGGRFDQPVSLLDVAPTLMELSGLEIPTEVEGISLVPLVRGDQGAAAALEARTLGFGRQLYGQDAWGLLHDDEKYITEQGREHVFDLVDDPGEATTLTKDDPDRALPLRARLPEALDMEVTTGWRFQPTNTRGNDAEPMHAVCSFPTPIRKAVVSVDPLANGAAAFETIDADTARSTIADWDGADPAHEVRDADTHLLMTWTGTHGVEIVVEPEGELQEIGHATRCTARWCTPIDGLRPCPTGVLQVEEVRDAGFGKWRTGMASVGWGRKRQLIWGLGILPVPPEGGASVDGADAELKGALEAIGYVEEGQ